ncbi:MAG: DUF2029 domain-containing protein [Candidatus Eremiobacteraeota bacterium]|nr:DUF2029 domain-containing protein [Candidatus Eremiobacteraeota bacterium]
MKVRGRFAALALALAALVLAIRAHDAPTNVMADFRAFYCGSRVAFEGRDPYRTEPLRSCEEQARPPAGPSFLAAVAMPAPLPGYALAAFAPLASLPFPVACTAWFGLLGLALASTIIVLQRLGAGPVDLLAASIAPVAFAESMLLGQPVPLVMLAIACAAWAARSGRPRLAALAAAAAMIEPHIGLAACAGLFLEAPRARPVLLAASAAALALSAALLGPAATLEYGAAVLPAHALANVPESSQLSLAAMLYALHVPAHAAVSAGDAMYALMLAAGVGAACRLRATDGDAAWLPLVPPAFVVFGGVHVHHAQAAAALPALLLLGARVPRVRTLALVAVALVAVPWFAVAHPLLLGAVPLFGALIARAAGGRNAMPIVFAVTCAGAAGTLGLAAFEHRITVEPVARAVAGALAEDGWGAYVRAALSGVGPVVAWLRAAVAGGLALGLAAFVAAAVPAVVPRGHRRLLPSTIS